MAVFKPKPVVPTPVRGKPVTPKPVAPTPVAPKPVIGKPVAPKPVVPTPVIGKPVMPGIKPLPPGSIGFRGGAPAKPLPPGSIGMPGGPGGKTVYNTGPMPGNVEQNYRGIPGLVNATAPIGNIANRFTGGPAPMPIKGAPNTFAGALLGGGAAPSLPVTGNKLNTAGFKNIAPVSFDMKKGGKVSSASKRADGIAQRGKTRA